MSESSLRLHSLDCLHSGFWVWDGCPRVGSPLSFFFQVKTGSSPPPTPSYKIIHSLHKTLKQYRRNMIVIWENHPKSYHPETTTVHIWWALFKSSLGIFKYIRLQFYTNGIIFCMLFWVSFLFKLLDIFLHQLIEIFVITLLATLYFYCICVPITLSTTLYFYCAYMSLNSVPYWILVISKPFTCRVSSLCGHLFIITL